MVFAEEKVEEQSDDRQQCEHHHPKDGHIGFAVLHDDEYDGAYHNQYEQYLE